jgi:hypothetical protein
MKGREAVSAVQPGRAKKSISFVLWSSQSREDRAGPFTQASVEMRLLTHNAMCNNSAEAKGKGFPLRITATVVKVDDGDADSAIDERRIGFVKSILPTLDWSVLVKV